MYPAKQRLLARPFAMPYLWRRTAEKYSEVDMHMSEDPLLQVLLESNPKR